jgi:hypothetical protein
MYKQFQQQVAAQGQYLEGNCIYMLLCATRFMTNILFQSFLKLAHTYTKNKVGKLGTFHPA